MLRRGRLFPHRTLSYVFGIAPAIWQFNLESKICFIGSICIPLIHGFHAVSNIFSRGAQFDTEI